MPASDHLPTRDYNTNLITLLYNCEACTVLFWSVEANLMKKWCLGESKIGLQNLLCHKLQQLPKNIWMKLVLQTSSLEYCCNLILQQNEIISGMISQFDGVGEWNHLWNVAEIISRECCKWCCRNNLWNVAIGVAEINCVSEMLQFIAMLHKKEISGM